MSKNNVVLSFHESLLRGSDVNLLRGPHWLNDMIISFYFEYLEKVVHKHEKSLLLVSPEVTQCLKMMSGEDVQIILDPLDFKLKDFVFFALNDNNSAGWPGGSHWSLLVYSRVEKKLYHFDSMNDHNLEQADLLHANLSQYLGTDNKIGRLESLKTLQQSNGYDCGIHLLCNVDLLIQHVLKNKRIQPNCPLADPVLIKNKRSNLIEIIEDLSRNNRSH